MTPTRLGSADLIRQVLDEGSFESWDFPVDRSGHDASYRAELEAAEQRAGTDESVVTGTGRIRGRQVAVIVSEFRFLGGSIGRATAERIVAAAERATRMGLPLVAAPASGGTRMQEGTPAFVKMVDISRAVLEHKRAGLPYLVYLRHPTTGGVFASWGSLGHMTIAEPGALIGFLGPVVYETLNGVPFPEGVQLAENLVAKGIVDAVVPADQLAEVAARALTLLTRPGSHHAPALPQRRPIRPGLVRVPSAMDMGTTGMPSRSVSGPSPTRESVWASVELTRRDDRPGVRELLRHAAEDVLPLQGTGEGESDRGVLLALASFAGRPCILVGQDRRNQVSTSMGPAALRTARRGFRMAEELRLPLVTVIDTPGADLSQEAEEGALAGEIARSLEDMVALTVPSVSVLLGQGTGGGALALLPAQRIIAAEHGWLSPLPPEGASAIVHQDIDHAPDLAFAQRISARQMFADGLVHAIVREREPANDAPVEFAHAVAKEIGHQLGLLSA